MELIENRNTKKYREKPLGFHLCVVVSVWVYVCVRMRVCICVYVL